MKLIAALRKRRSAKRYARELAPWLRRNYGASRHYTPQQLRAAVRALALDERFIAFAYAAFLPEAEYDALSTHMPWWLPYEEARDTFARFVPPTGFATSGDSAEGLAGTPTSPDHPSGDSHSG